MDVSIHRVHSVEAVHEYEEGDESCPSFHCTTITIMSTDHTGVVIREELRLFSDQSIAIESSMKATS